MSIRLSVVAAAFVGACIAASVVAALAFASGNRAAATVTLQVAPRGLGTVTVVPADNNKTSECSDNADGASCSLTFNRGQRVTLTASGNPGHKLSSWSTPDCPGTGDCSLTLDDDSTSIVAIFDPLRLGVILSSSGSGLVTMDPAGQPCAGNDELGNADFCSEFAPGTKVKVTVQNQNGTFDHWNQGCEPTNATTCTITVGDETTWVGAHFVGDDANLPQLPTTIKVQFQLKRGGTGSGRVSASNLDCGTACSREYGYGDSLTLTAVPDQGSVFSGWNGVCAKTQTMCTVPVGPITSIRAIFDRDTVPPSTPGGLAVASATRTGIQINWTASSDNVAVSGYRVYLDDATAGDTHDTTFSYTNLVCGHRYTLAVDAADAVGNRSPRASITGETQACPLAVRVAGVGVERRQHARRLRVTLRVNRPTSAVLMLLRGRAVVARGRYGVKPGSNDLRLTIPQALKGGSYRLRITVVNPDGGTLVLPGRGIMLPRPK